MKKTQIYALLYDNVRYQIAQDISDMLSLNMVMFQDPNKLIREVKSIDLSIQNALISDSLNSIDIANQYFNELFLVHYSPVIPIINSTVSINSIELDFNSFDKAFNS